MNKEETANQWPAELDALIAAPKHHTLLFENEFVRVLDTNIPAGETTKMHMHQYPSALYLVKWSDFIRYDSHGNVSVDSRTMAKPPEPATALWSGPLAPHSLKNVGENELHLISVEIKNK